MSEPTTSTTPAAASDETLARARRINRLEEELTLWRAHHAEAQEQLRVARRECAVAKFRAEDGQHSTKAERDVFFQLYGKLVGMVTTYEENERFCAVSLEWAEGKLAQEREADEAEGICRACGTNLNSAGGCPACEAADEYQNERPSVDGPEVRVINGEEYVICPRCRGVYPADGDDMAEGDVCKDCHAVERAQEESEFEG